MANKIVQEPIAHILGEAFGRYAKYIIQDRALPDIRDGLKPVQRRILYAMYNLGLTSDKPFKKSARTVGEVIGKYHPHGDSSIYEAMVRMSQDWKNNLPLLEMHGNNGSIDGDGAAAMRYTECRLAAVAELMLGNLKKDTVPMMFNFDDTEREPTVLPALLPNLLINGAMGIAAGYATNIPPHNSTEVFNALIHRIDHPDATLETMMQIIPGPDFPTGGVIQGIEGIREAFATGRGKFIVSSRIHFRSGQKINQIVVTEIPYETSKSAIIREIYELGVPGVVEVRDESDQTGLQIVIDVKPDADVEHIRNFLLKNTHLQVNYATNFVVITKRHPRTTPLLEALDDYLIHAREVVVRGAQYDLDRAQKRCEIVEGLIKAVSQIDAVVGIIRQSTSKEDAKERLAATFQFTPAQAEAIVTLRLYRLTQTDRTALEAEHAELMETIRNLEQLLGSDKVQKTYLKNLFREYRKQYGQERKSLILRDVEKIAVDATKMVEKKSVGVVVTRQGYIKVFPQKSDGDLANWGIHPTDGVLKFCYTDTQQNLLLITRFGRAINLPIYKIKVGKWKDGGVHLNEIVDLASGDQVVQAFIYGVPLGNLVLLVRSGLAKRMAFADAIGKTKAINVIKLRTGDEVVDALHECGQPLLMALNRNGNALIFPVEEIPVSQKTSMGVVALKLKEDEGLGAATLLTTEDTTALAWAPQGVKVVKLADVPRFHRGASGRPISTVVKSRVVEFQGLMAVGHETTVQIMDDTQVVHTIPVKDLPTGQKVAVLGYGIESIFEVGR